MNLHKCRSCHFWSIESCMHPEMIEPTKNCPCYKLHSVNTKWQKTEVFVYKLLERLASKVNVRLSPAWYVRTTQDVSKRLKSGRGEDLFLDTISTRNTNLVEYLDWSIKGRIRYLTNEDKITVIVEEAEKILDKQVQYHTGRI